MKRLIRCVIAVWLLTEAGIHHTHWSVIVMLALSFLASEVKS